MVDCEVVTSDKIVWNTMDVVRALVTAAVQDQPITLDLLAEGPDFCELNIADFVLQLPELYNYDLSKVTILTDNIKQLPLGRVNFKKFFPYHFVESTQTSCQNIDIQKKLDHTFGIFIGRSNQHRLDLSSYLFNNYNNKTNQTFHYSDHSDFHRDNLGLDNLVSTNIDSALTASNFLLHCPIKRKENLTYPILMDQHCNLYEEYNNFFVEIVCETFFSGHTFFPTEKTWRPIALGTPFITQGPSQFLTELKLLGFETFSYWWEEGYADDPADYQVTEIKKVLDFLAELEQDDLEQMYREMKPILDHNKNLFFSLKEQDLPC